MKPIQVVHHDFKYAGVDYDTDSDYGTKEENYSHIINKKITSVDVYDMTKELTKGIKLPNIDKYCIQRLLVSSKVYDPNIWGLEVRGSYYGEEIGKITLDDDIAHKLEASITYVLAFPTLKEKLFYILEQEYGYVLDALKVCNVFDIVELTKDDISFGSRDYYRRIDAEAKEIYSQALKNDPSMICGVCIPDGVRYRLIDGYHRCTAIPEIVNGKGKKIPFKANMIVGYNIRG